MTRDAGNLFQYFTTHTENAPHLHRRRLGSCSIPQVCPLSPARGGRRKRSDGLRSTSRLKILKVRMMSARMQLRSSEKLAKPSLIWHVTEAVFKGMDFLQQLNINSQCDGDGFHCIPKVWSHYGTEQLDKSVKDRQAMNSNRLVVFVVLKQLQLITYVMWCENIQAVVDGCFERFSHLIITSQS